MVYNFWTEFSILLAAAIVGSLAILPYSLRLLKSSKKKKPLKMPLWVLLVLGVAQNVVLFTIGIGIGLLASHSIGLGAPYVQSLIAGQGSSNVLAHMLPVAITLGVGGGLLLLIADVLFLPHLPAKLLETARKTTQWENFTASFYGGINEELLMRFFGMSVVVWLLARLWHTSIGPTDTDFWIANVVLAVIFAIGHLPALKGLVGKITGALWARTLLLNMSIGLICGWLFWHYGIEAAIVAHFTADIVYHMGGTVVLRLNDRHHFISVGR